MRRYRYRSYRSEPKPHALDHMALTQDEWKLKTATLWPEEPGDRISTPYHEREKNFLIKINTMRNERWTPEFRAITVSGPAMLTDVAKKLRPEILYEGDLVASIRFTNVGTPQVKRTIVYGTVTESFPGQAQSSENFGYDSSWKVWWTDTSRCEPVTILSLSEDLVRLVS